MIDPITDIILEREIKCRQQKKMWRKSVSAKNALAKKCKLIRKRIGTDSPEYRQCKDQLDAAEQSAEHMYKRYKDDCRRRELTTKRRKRRRR